jgi:hypothetical protein
MLPRFAPSIQNSLYKKYKSIDYSLIKDISYIDNEAYAWYASFEIRKRFGYEHSVLNNMDINMGCNILRYSLPTHDVL